MSQDVFQMKMDIIMEKCPGVISIHNDIVIYGTSDQDHDANLINLLNVAQLEGLILNSKKLELKRPKVSFFGAEYSVDGMHPCPKKIQGITNMTPPIDKQQLASFIGMVTYIGNFEPHLSHHTEPLRAMLKQDAVFHWDEASNASFQKIKNLIAKTASQLLRYYDRMKPVTVQADASQRGLGACLVQVRKHRKGTPCHCICLPALQHLCAWEAVHSWERPQALGDDTSEEPSKCPSQATANVASTPEVQSHYQVQARKGHAAPRCIEQVPQPWLWGNQAGHACRLCCL